jgi:amino acid transporter
MSEPTGGGNQKPEHDQDQEPYYPAHGLQSYEAGAPTESNVSAVVLTILSVLSLCNFLALGSLALGIIALAKRSTDPEGSRRLTRIGWIVFAVVWALVIVSIVAFLVFTRVRSSDVPFDSRV